MRKGGRHRGRGGLGISKHRRSGKTTKSPRARFRMKLDAERDERKAPAPQCTAETMDDLLRKR